MTYAQAKDLSRKSKEAAARAIERAKQELRAEELETATLHGHEAAHWFLTKALPKCLSTGQRVLFFPEAGVGPWGTGGASMYVYALDYEDGGNSVVFSLCNSLEFEGAAMKGFRDTVMATGGYPETCFQTLDENVHETRSQDLDDDESAWSRVRISLME